MDLESLYQEIILDHYKHPRGRGLHEPFDVEVHHVNPTCGDELTVRVRVEDGRLADVSYDGQGCSISQASASVMHEQLTGDSVVHALEVTDSFVELMHGRGSVEPDEDLLGDGVAFAGVAKYPARVKCALLGWMACKDAVSQAVGRGASEVAT